MNCIIDSKTKKKARKENTNHLADGKNTKWLKNCKIKIASKNKTFNRPQNTNS